LTVEEHLKCIEFAASRVNKKIPVIAGTGNNCVDKAKYLSLKACELGADALLVVTPYYNKANADGLIKYYSEIADLSTKPIILYNVPSRTGVNIPLDVYIKLSEHENIAGVKEASGNISAIAVLPSNVREDFAIYSGNDDQILPTLSIGGSGVISVVSNILPKETQRLCDAYFAHDTETARKLQLGLMDIINALFSDVNPIPVKYAMSVLGYCSGELRPPLTETADITKLLINQLLINHKLI
jgi:4-hydroxy-tetrahydrodipicolinate synthase